MCLGETHGHVKILCNPKTGELLGGHIVGPEAAELIHELIAIMYYHGTVHDLNRDASLPPNPCRDPHIPSRRTGV